MTAEPLPATITELLTAQAHRWDEAIVRKDRAAIEANMAEDFRQIDGAGNVETRWKTSTCACTATWRCWPAARA
jgi:hypothetical protein